jgi:hypothetical protein
VNEAKQEELSFLPPFANEANRALDVQIQVQAHLPHFMPKH